MDNAKAVTIEYDKLDLRPEDVDNMDFEEAFEWLEQRQIPFDHLVNLDDMRAVIRQHLENGRSDEDADGTSKAKPGDGTSSQSLLEEILAKDKKMKEELSNVYLELMKFLKSVGDDMRTVMEKLHGDFDEKLATYERELVNDDCPIVVAGETSAGKSSLLNLLLGTDLLPHSLLCATSTICRLHNSSNKRFEIITKDNDTIQIEVDTDDQDADEKLKAKLKPYVSCTESRKEHQYKQVEIYWPIPMLQDRVTIVDTPGVGENDEISERLFEYLPNAVAFIYVINSANSGGIQEDRLLYILNKQDKWRTEGRLTPFDYTSTIFVCNKWDKVEKRHEDKKVWADTTLKLQKALPDFPLNQVFKMSVTEAERFKKSGMVSKKYKSLLDGIEGLVPASLKSKITRHFKFLEMFLQQMKSRTMSRINHAKKSAEEKNKLYDDVVGRLNKLKSDSDRVKDHLLNAAKDECQLIMDKLQTYLQSDEVKNRLLSWREEDVPDIDADDFEVTKFKGETIIISRTVNLLKEWEEENNLVKQASNRLTEKFKTECQIISKDYTDVNVVIEGFLDEDLSLALGFVSPGKQEGPLFSKSEQIILAVAAPLWVPLVTAASLLFLPVGVGMFIKETIKASKQRKDFTENKIKYMKDWTEKIINTAFSEENIKNFIFRVYFENFKKKIVELCDEFIPKQIAADEKQMNMIANDRRTSQEILSEFQPLLYDLNMIMGKLRLYELKYVSKDLIDRSELHIEKKVGRGNFSDVYLAYWTNEDKKEKVALKVLRRKMTGNNMISQLEEVDCLRKFHHDNIIKIHGVCYACNEEDHDMTDNCKRLTMVLEYCESSLEELVFKDETLQCRTYKSVQQRYEAFKFYVTMSAGVCDGLAEMHQRGYLHRDLKLSNVLVSNNTAKLCDLGFARMEVSMTGTFVGTMTHMSPELLNHQSYSFSSDIYSLAILLWELWYGHHVYTESEYSGVSTFKLLDAIKNGTRPKLIWKFCPTNELKEIITACWEHDPSRRPSASQVAGELRSMFHAYHNE